MQIISQVASIRYQPRVHQWHAFDKHDRLRATAGEQQLQVLTGEYPLAVVRPKETCYRDYRNINTLTIKHPERPITMKLTKTDEIIPTKGRQAAPNPFLKDPKVLAQLQKGDTFRINVEANEKASTIVNQLRKAAETINMTVSVGLDVGTVKLADAQTFRVQLKAKKDKTEVAAEAVTA